MAVSRKVKPSLDELKNAVDKRIDEIPPRDPTADNKKPPIPEGQKDTPPAGPDEPTKEKKVLITAKVNESTLKTWKQFCLDNDTNLTDTIKRAVNYYIKAVNNGSIEL